MLASIFQIFCHPARRFSACLFNKSEKYFLPAHLFHPACLAFSPNWLLLTILMVIFSLLVYHTLEKTFTLLVYSNLLVYIYFFKCQPACLLRSARVLGTSENLLMYGSRVWALFRFVSTCHTQYSLSQRNCFLEEDLLVYG